MSDRLELRITGMNCGSCVARVEKALVQLPGVTSATVNLATEKAQILFDSKTMDPQAVIAGVKKAGYGAERIDSELSSFSSSAPAPASDLNRERRKVAIALILTLPLVIPMLLPHTLHLPPWLQLCIAAPVQFILGAHFYRSAWKALQARTGNMDLLVALGTTAAFLLSTYHGLKSPYVLSEAYPLYFESSAVIIALVLLGKYWEARAKYQTTGAIRDLQALRPSHARVRREDGDQDIPVNSIRLGDRLVVRPGERIAADGIIVEGASFVDESMITGESLPASKSPSNRVTGGTLNGDGLLLIQVDALGAETTLARMVRLIEDAQATKPAVQLLVDRISAIFVPVIVGIALLTLGFWLIATGDLPSAMVRAVAVLVIACPCALGLATPTAIMVGTGMAAKAGILIRDPDAIETAEKIKWIIFDKTGTLTEGQPQLKKWIPFGRPESELIALSVALQSGSEHPLARALLKHFPGIPPQPISDFRALPGRGLEGRVQGLMYRIGNEALMLESNIDTKVAASTLHEFAVQGLSVSLVADLENSEIIGLLGFEDTVKSNAVLAVQALKSLGLRLTILTGDNRFSAESVGKALGISEIHAECTPEQKLRFIQTAKSTGQSIAVVGDGINDAPALAAADLSLAMGSGTDVAMQASSVTLMRGDLSLVADSLRIGRAISRKIKQNLFWAFFYNLVGIPLAAFGYLNPMVAAGAMAFSSVSVVSNSLLLRRWKPTPLGGTRP